VSEPHRLKEAQLFLDKMNEDGVNGNPEEFGCYLSACMSAARSVMQCILKKAEEQGERTWYDALAGSSPWDRCSRALRNTSVHARPYNPPAHHILIRERGLLRSAPILRSVFGRAAAEHQEGTDRGGSADSIGPTNALAPSWLPHPQTSTVPLAAITTRRRRQTAPTSTPKP
jgi:hypothetical protein